MNPRLARTLVFVTSASVLVIEILAARLLAPYLGVSLEVFTGIIGVILAGISIGAWLGGRAADRTDPHRLVGPLLVGGGVTALASPLIVDTIGPALAPDPASIVIASVAGFFAPAALLSAVSPVVVKIQLASLAETGSVVGSYSAVGTAGAILGTFSTGFVLIAAFPTRPILAVLGGVLAVAGVAMAAARSRWALPSLFVAGLLAVVIIVASGPCDQETTYHCAIVMEDPARDTGRVLVLDRMRNSYVDLADPEHLEFRYVQLIADVMAAHLPPEPEPLDVVSIGGGGFTLPGYVEHTRPGSANTVLEIDAELVEIGRDELGLGPGIEVIVSDARISLRRLPPASAELVIGDAYSGASVPWHLTTLEFSRQIEQVMTDDGIYVMNVIDYGALEFARAEAATLVQVFDEVALLAPPDYIDGDGGGNFILVAANRRIDLEAVAAEVRRRGGAEIGITDRALQDFIGDAPTLTDDFAPVDQMLATPGF